MKKGYTEEEIIKAIKDHEAGIKVDKYAVVSAYPLAPSTSWRSKYAGMEISEAKHMKNVSWKPIS